MDLIEIADALDAAERTGTEGSEIITLLATLATQMSFDIRRYAAYMTAGSGLTYQAMRD